MEIEEIERERKSDGSWGFTWFSYVSLRPRDEA